MTRTLAIAVLLAWCVAPAAEPAAGQAPAVDTRCDALLTAEEVEAVVGTAYHGPGVREPRPGFTICEWEGSDTNFGFTFANLTNLKAEETTAGAMYDIDLQAVENETRKREPLPDVGVPAAKVNLGDEAWLVEVQRPDGVARMTFYKVAPEPMLALVRALAAP